MANLLWVQCYLKISDVALEIREGANYGLLTCMYIHVYIYIRMREHQLGDTERYQRLILLNGCNQHLNKYYQSMISWGFIGERMRDITN